MNPSQEELMNQLGLAMESWRGDSLQAQEALDLRLQTATATLKKALISPEDELQALRTCLEQQGQQSCALLEEVESLRTENARLREENKGLQEQLARQALSEGQNLSQAAAVAISENLVFDAQGHKRRMGEILLEIGIVDQEQLAALLNTQKAGPHRPLGKLVVDCGFTNEEVIARILAVQLRLPYSALNENDIDPEVARQFPLHLARQHHCLGIGHKGDNLLLAMSHPMDLIAIENIELYTRRLVEPVVTTSSAVEYAIAHFSPETNAMPLEENQI